MLDCWKFKDDEGFWILRGLKNAKVQDERRFDVKVLAEILGFEGGGCLEHDRFEDKEVKIILRWKDILKESL